MQNYMPDPKPYPKLNLNIHLNPQMVFLKKSGQDKKVLIRSRTQIGPQKDSTRTHTPHVFSMSSYRTAGYRKYLESEDTNRENPMNQLDARGKGAGLDSM